MNPEKHRCPGGATQASADDSFDSNILPDATVKVVGRAVPLAPDYLERFTLRMLQDALAQGTRGYWQRRAAVLEDARPRRGDFHGRATRESLQARYDRLTLQADQCRVHGDLFEHDDVDAALVAEILGYGALAIIGDAMESDAARWQETAVAA